MKKIILLSTMLGLMTTGAANAQETLQQSSGQAYTYVQQNGTKIDALGTAAFEISPGSHPMIQFDANGKAVLKIGENTVAVLPTDDNGQLVIEFETTVNETDLNKVTKTYTNGYATIYSPFQLQVPASGTVEVHAPTYDAEKHVVKCNSTTQVAASAVIPAETALLLKNAGTIEFTISDGAATDTHVSDLSGSSLQIDVPVLASGNMLFTLGHKSNDASKYGFFQYTGSRLNPGLAWLEAASLTQEAKCYAISLDEDETTSISKCRDESFKTKEGKFLEHGRIVIVKNGKKYNLNGQEVK